MHYHQVHAHVYRGNTRVPSAKHQFVPPNVGTAEHVYHPGNVPVSRPTSVDIVKLRCVPTTPRAFLGIAMTQSSVTVVMDSQEIQDSIDVKHWIAITLRLSQKPLLFWLI